MEASASVNVLIFAFWVLFIIDAGVFCTLLIHVFKERYSAKGMQCDVCREAAFINVEATKFVESEDTLRPYSYCVDACFCPKCGRLIRSIRKAGAENAD